MPLYGYECDDCGALLEAEMKMDERDIPTTYPCPKCGEHSLRRSMSSGVRWILKGPDWSKDGSGCMRKS